MAFSAAKGTISCPASTGSSSVTTLTFQPKAVLFWGTKQTATGIADDAVMYLGAATSSTEEWCISTFADDNVGTTSCSYFISVSKCIHAPATKTTTAIAADFTSMDANGFTVNFSTVTSGVIIHYLALGGSDITNAKAGNFLLPKATTGNVDVTDPGFTPDLTMFGYAYGNPTLDSFVGGNVHGMGAGTTSSARWTTCQAGQDGQTMTGNVDAMTTQRTDNIFISLAADATQNALADYSGGIANGFRINISDSSAILDCRIGYLCLKGGSYAVGAFNASTSGGGTNDINVGFTPEAVLLSTWSLATSTSITADAQMNRGACTYDGTEGWAGSTYNDATLNTQCDSVTETTKCIGSLIEGATATLDSEADSDLTGVGGANTFRLTWSDAPAVAAEVCYIAFGPHGAGITTEYVAPVVQQTARGNVTIGRQYV